uniref:cistern family PEP-CTERM protein n=1 Tax=Trichocoleus desertorum TaxID=1481672 RepID=UPI0025B37F2E|nr:cistern family PEP-CTERM protein [Trichocoleus desertorum]
MLRSFTNLALGVSVLSALGTLAIAPTASAFTFNGSGIEIGTKDAGTSFKVNFDGNVSTKNVIGLSSEAIFKFLGFTTVGSKTEAAFEITLDNTSSDGITSRTSALGFNVNQTLVGVGGASGSGNTRSSGIFTNDMSGSFPNQFGAVDVCFTSGNTCQGGKNGGVKTADSPGKFSSTLAFSGNVQSFTLSNFGVRYQSIDGNGFKGDSGTGRGIPVQPEPPKPPTKHVPEPSSTAALVVLGAGLLYGRKKRSELA